MSDKKPTALEQNVYIWLSGYSTEGKFTLGEWLYAKEWCHRNSASVKNYRDKHSGTFIAVI